MERAALRDERLQMYREKLEEAERQRQQLREDEQRAVRRARNRLMQTVIPCLVHGLGESLEACVSSHNTALQRVLGDIDEGLSEGKDRLKEAGQLRATLLETAGHLCQRPLLDDDAGTVMINGVSGGEVLEGFQSSTEQVINDINELRLKPDGLLSFVEDKISSIADCFCSRLEKEAEVMGGRRTMEHKAKVQEAEYQLQQAAFLLGKMGALQGQLGSWLNTQH